jgi:hypothetical protein
MILNNNSHERQKLTAKAGSAWDEETVDYFATSNQFNVRITSLSQRSGFGSTSSGEPMREPNGFHISGLILYPRLVLVAITLERDLDDFGVWSYNLHDAPNGSTNIEAPLLEFVVADPLGNIAEALYQAQRAALTAGRRYSLARFWKRKGDGAMTADTREGGCGYESRYPLLGMYSWVELQATDLPNWALPIWDNQFSLSELPGSDHLTTRLQGGPTPTLPLHRWATKLIGTYL